LESQGGSPPSWLAGSSVCRRFRRREHGAGWSGRRVLGRLLPVVYANVVEVVVLLLLIGVFLWMAARWLDHRPIVDYGFHLSRPWWLDLGFGLALGAFLMAGVYALALAIGWVKVTGTFVSPPGQPFIGAILADVVLVVGIACWEEIVFSGLRHQEPGRRFLLEDHRCSVGDGDRHPHTVGVVRFGPCR
jgi:hypothetical protein